MQPSRFIRALIVVAGLGSFSMPAFASDISLDTWYCGRFEQAGSMLLGGSSQPLSVCQELAPMSMLFGDPGPAPWTFVVGPVGAILEITDVEFYGDMFTLTDVRVHEGMSTTSVFDVEGEEPPDFAGLSDEDFEIAVARASACMADVLCAFSNTDYSSGLFALGPGSHSLSGVHRGMVDAGNFAFRIRDLSVPAPAGVAIVALVLSLLPLRAKARARG